MFSFMPYSFEISRARFAKTKILVLTVEKVSVLSENAEHIAFSPVMPMYSIIFLSLLFNYFRWKKISVNIIHHNTYSIYN